MSAAAVPSAETPPVVQPKGIRPARPGSQPHAGLFSTLNTWIGHLDWLAVALVALMSLALHIRFVTHVGGLWRDEANSVQVASLPHLSDVWHSLEFDSFPLLFFGLLRGWTAIFDAHNQTALRALGLITGLAMMATLWISTRKLGVRKPVLSLALIGLNPMLIRYGDSTRAYGLGIILILLTFASFWRLADSPSRPSWGKVVRAGLLAVLSTQCVYYNSVLLFAIIIATVVVCIRKKSWQTAVISIGIGAVAAAFLTPYLPMMVRMREWTFLVSYNIDLSWLWHRSCEVLGSPDPLGICLWVALFALAIGGPIAIVYLNDRSRLTATGLDRNSVTTFRIPDAVLFAVIALSVAVPAYGVFLAVLRYHTQPWYYISLVAFVGFAMDVAFGAWPRLTSFRPALLLRAVRPTAAIGLLCLTAVPDWKDIATRHTNMDLLANRLASLTENGDVVLVCEWENAVALAYHYHGPAEIVTVPDLPEHRFHRYDLVLRQLLMEDPVQTIRPRLEKALRAGHSVFVAGRLLFPPASVRLYKAPLAPGEHNSEASRKYYRFWQLQVGQFLRQHTTRVGLIPIPVPGNAQVQDFENVDLSVIRGWQ